ncbi:MAG: radical SAM protein [Acidobacteriota bacterium]
MSLATLRPYVDASVSTLPLLTVHVTAACDSRCIGCSYGGGAGPVLTRAVAASLAREADALDVRVLLVTGGEPLTVPDLEDLLRPFQRDRRRLYLATSGTRLAARADLVARCFHEVFVSLDGPDAEIHDAIRGLPSFDAIARGVGAVAAIAPVPFTARTTVQRRNVDHLEATIAASRAMGIGRISFLPVDAWSGAFGRHGGEELSGLLPTADQLARLRASIAGIEERIGPELIPNLEHVLRHLEAAIGLHPFPPKRCNTPMVSAVVEADGTVRPCFFKAPLGRIVDGGLAAVINGEAGRKLRADLDTRTDRECLACVCPKYFPLRDLLLGKIR